jgi:hypothetical protein
MDKRRRRRTKVYKDAGQFVPSERGFTAANAAKAIAILLRAGRKSIFLGKYISRS